MQRDTRADRPHVVRRAAVHAGEHVEDGCSVDGDLRDAPLRSVPMAHGAEVANRPDIVLAATPYPVQRDGHVIGNRGPGAATVRRGAAMVVIRLGGQYPYFV